MPSSVPMRVRARAVADEDVPPPPSSPPPVSDMPSSVPSRVRARAVVKDVPSESDVPPPPPPPVDVRPTRTDLLNKTRRKSVELSGSPVGEARSKLNAAANKAEMERLYAKFYGNDGRKLPKADVSTLYNEMGTGKTSYGEVPITDADFDAFMSTKIGKITGQKGEPKDTVGKGDYFHVHNDKYRIPKDGQGRKGRARRIIVNVNSQKAGLKVTEGLNELINADPKVAKSLSEYKIYLSKSKITKNMKYDKLVIYYTADPTDPDGVDDVGNRIATKLNSSIKPADVEKGFAPFYSNIAPGLAWAEEPKQYVTGLTGSFTRTRSNVIASVINKNPVIRSKEDFIAKVNQAMDDAGVDAAAPHRHQVAT